MNVLLATPWDNIGGVSQVVNYVATYLRDRGHGVFYLLPGDRTNPVETVSRIGFPAFRMNMRVPLLPGRATKSVSAFTAWLPVTSGELVALTRKLNIDVINVHYPVESGLYFALLRHIRPVRLVTAIHGADILPNGHVRESYPAGVRAVLNHSHLLITPSESYKRSVLEAIPNVRPPIISIPNGIDVDELRSPTAPRAADAPPYVLCIAQLVAYKGVDVLIRAFSSLMADYPGLRLKLVSDGPHRAEFEELSRALGISHLVDFLGRRDRPEVVELLHGCHFFVLPSRSASESFGIAAAEALACDRAVIASRIGGLPELITHERTGLLVPPGDHVALALAMRRLLDDDALRARLASQGGESVRSTYSWTRTGAAYERALSSVARSLHETPAVSALRHR
jgi:glycosyltransferase involved in cell wall biosynthesis